MSSAAVFVGEGGGDVCDIGNDDGVLVFGALFLNIVATKCTRIV